MDERRNSNMGSHRGAQDVMVRLEEQDRKFALNKKDHVTGELQLYDDKMIFSADNLKPAESGYKLFFIGRRNGSSVYKIIGNIVPDRRGHAELQCSINPDDIDGEGTALSCFYIFMVTCMSSPMQPVLKGDYIKDDSEVKPKYIAGKNERHNKQRNNGEKSGAYNDYYRYYILEKCTVLDHEMDRLEKISPFQEEWLADNWKRVADILKLPVASTGAERQIEKYGHFIFGSTEKHFYLGVPGRHDNEEWPDRGKSGFLLWQSIRGSEEYGYWAMVIDCKTGIITEIS